MGERPAPGLVAGRVGRPHGLDGSFHVTGPRSRLLELGARVTLDGVEREIVRRAGTDERPVLRVAGLDSREAIDALRGADLVLAREDAPPLDDDEFWAEDFAGCRVVDGDVEVGTVRRLLAYPSCELLEVEREGREALLVPLAGEAVRSLDVPGGRIDIDLAFLGED